MTNKTLILACLAILLWGFSFASPKIILKLDDLSVKKGICEFIPTLNHLMRKQIKAGLGIIAVRNDSTAYSVLSPYLNATDTNGKKLFEIWNHGLDHVRPEFQGTGYEYQKSHFEEADQRVRKLIGIQMHTFGTPYNNSDSVTNQVISEHPEYRVFLFNSKNSDEKKGILYLDNRVNMENGTGNPEFGFFVDNYTRNKAKYKDYMILQGHPNKWTPEKLQEFEKIVGFLVSEGCEFILPYEFYQSQNIPMEIKAGKNSRKN